MQCGKNAGYTIWNVHISSCISGGYQNTNVTCDASLSIVNAVRSYFVTLVELFHLYEILKIICAISCGDFLLNSSAAVTL